MSGEGVFFVTDALTISNWSEMITRSCVISLGRDYSFLEKVGFLGKALNFITARGLPIVLLAASH